MQNKSDSSTNLLENIYDILNSGTVQEIIEKHPELLTLEFLHKRININQWGDLTVFQYLLKSKKGIRIAIQIPDFLQKGDVIVDPDSGNTLLWDMARSARGRKVLSKNPELLQKGNLNAIPARHFYYKEGTTILWLLANKPSGIDLLLEQPELLLKGDINAGPPINLPEKNVTSGDVAQLANGRELSEQHLESHEKKPPGRGITVAYLLAKAKEYSLLEHYVNSAQLNNENIIDLAAQKSDKEPRLIDLLFEGEQFSLLKDMIKQYLVLNKHTELQQIIDSSPEQLKSHLESLIPFLQAEAIYIGFTSTGLRDVEGEKELEEDVVMINKESKIKEDTESFLKFIEEIEDGSFYYKDAQHLKAMLNGALFEKGLLLSSPDDSPQYRQSAPEDISLAVSIEALARAGKYSVLTNMLLDHLSAIRHGVKRKSPELSSEEGEKESEKRTAIPDIETSLPPLKRSRQFFFESAQNEESPDKNESPDISPKPD